MTDNIPQTISAALMFIDNSNSSIDGDYRPTRISAQKEAVERFCDFFKRGNPQSVFGFGGMADADFGVKVSFARETKYITKPLTTVKTGGKIHLEKAIRCGILAMNQRPKDIKNQILIFFVSSQHDLTNEKAESIATIAHGKGICINIFVFGDEDIDEEPLKYLIEKMNDSSHYNRIPNGPVQLAHAVINQYCSNFNTSIPQSSMDRYLMDEDDAELQSVLAQSRQEMGDDPDILAAIEASLQEQNLQPKANEEEEMDEDLLNAMELSKQPLEDDDNTEHKEGGIDNQIEQLMNDPDQLNNILTEFNEDKNKKDDTDKKDDKDKKDDQKK